MTRVPPPRRCTTEQHARELFELPPEWVVVAWSRVGPSEDQRWTGNAVTLEGAVCPPISRGPRKGRPDWRRRDRDTQIKITISDKQHDAWCARWEVEERRCFECEGTGEVWASWSADKGTTYRECARCAGSGSPTLVETEHEDPADPVIPVPVPAGAA